MWVRRGLAILFLLIPLLWTTWGWQPASRNHQQVLRFAAIAPAADQVTGLGPFRLEGLWRMDSPNSRFGGWSAMIDVGTGQFLAFSDRNMRLRFTPPGVATPDIPKAKQVGIRRAVYFKGSRREWAVFDIESAVAAPDDSIWFGLEDDDRLIRIDADRSKGAFIRMPALKGWPKNGGPEAMARLRDGRWLLLCETCGARRGGLHLGLVFADAPDRAKPQSFGIALPPGFDPVDMAQLPDGHLLILTRRLALFPPHFESGLVLADPARLDPERPLPTQELARIDTPPLRENYEAMVVQDAPQGPLVWLLSDDNGMALQETRLMKLRLDTKRLPH
jgi:hypothetical protein